MTLPLGAALLALASLGASANPLLLFLGGETGDAAAGSGTYYADSFDGSSNCASAAAVFGVGIYAVGATDGIYTTDESGTTLEGEWVMDYPASAVACTGNQGVVLRVRKSGTGGSDALVIGLYTDATDDGDCSANLISTYCSSNTVTSSTGQDITCTLPCAEMPDTWPQMQIEITGQCAGGGPNLRCPQIDSITWGANWLE